MSIKDLVQWIQSVIPLVGILLFIGCRTQQPLELEQQVDSTVQTSQETTVTTESSVKLDEEIDQLYQSWWKKLTEITGSWQRDEYSAPDSTGQQYKTATIVGQFNSSSEEERQYSTRINSSIQAVISENSVIKNRLDAIERTITDLSAERKEALSWWQSALIWLGGIMIVVVLIKLFWRKLP